MPLHICYQSGKEKQSLFYPLVFLHIYPSENFDLYKQIAQNHLVLSEYPPFVYPSAPQFYRAHQLMQELSEVMVVIESVKDDKRLKLVEQLVEEGKVI